MSRLGAYEVSENIGEPRTSLADISERLDEFRRRIDALDEQIVRLLNQRASCANQIGEVKESVGMATYQPSREKDVLTHVQHVNDGPLADEAVARVFERIIDESRHLEELTNDGGEVHAETGGD